MTPPHDVFVVPTGAVTQATVRKLERRGILVVETTEPERCRFLRATEIVSGTDLLWAALAAMQVQKGEFGSDGEKIRARFAVRVFELVQAAHDQAHPPPIEGS